MRALRILAPVRLINARQIDANQRLQRAAFAAGLSSVILEFALSDATLANWGDAYFGPAGFLPGKLHPATVLLFLAVFMVLILARPMGSGLLRLFHDKPALALLNTLFLLCALYSIANVGLGGAAVYVESFLSAGLLAVVLEGGTDRQKRALGWWILGLSGLSIMISIGEGAIRNGDAQELISDAADSHGSGLFGTASTAAMVTSMTVFLLLRMRMNGLLKAVWFAALLTGLLSFGSPELTTTLILVLLAAFVVLVRGLVMRSLSLSVVGAIGAAIVIVPPVLLMLIIGTDTSEPSFVNMAADDGAGASSLQWLVLNHLDLRDVLFGASPARLDILQSQLSLGQNPTEIDNFWLRAFLHLGAICSFLLLLALGLLLVHLGRTAAHPLGWLLLTAAVLIDATGNLNGSHRVDLFFIAACMIAMNGYPRVLSPVFRPRGAINHLQRLSDDRMVERLGNRRSTHANLAGQRS